MKKIRVQSLKEIASKVYIISLNYQKEFIPGQVIELTEDPALSPRLYSICSPPGARKLDILFDLKKGGRLTPIMAKMKTGSFLFAGEPLGNFTSKENEKAYWIAAGTGIAPFASMFFSQNIQNKILVHGGKRIESFYFQEQFKKVLKENYIRCCTSEQSPDVYPGRLTSWLREQKYLPLDYKYYLCGSAEMVVQTRDILVTRGIDFESVIAEIYF